MKARALVVARGIGETTRRQLASLGLLRSDLAIQEEGDLLVLPIVEGSEVPAGLGSVEEREFVPRAPGGPTSYQDLLRDWPEPEQRLLPRSFDVVGDIVLVRVPPELERRRFELGEALLRFVPGTRIVGADRGVRGEHRLREVERIAGSGGWATVHRENQVELEIDVEKAYFSPRLAREHAEVAAAVRDGETVYDLCCGVGPFAVTIARDGRARHVTAVDLNPEAISLLRRTLARLGLTERVTAIEGRVEEFAASAAPAGRVVLNLPREGIKYAPLVARLVAPGGQFHYYEVVARDELEERGRVIEGVLGPRGTFALVAAHVVHPYSPASDLVSFRFTRGTD